MRCCLRSFSVGFASQYRYVLCWIETIFTNALIEGGYICAIILIYKFFLD